MKRLVVCDKYTFSVELGVSGCTWDALALGEAVAGLAHKADMVGVVLDDAVGDQIGEGQSEEESQNDDFHLILILTDLFFMLLIIVYKATVEKIISNC